jgi:hypothetical protein
MKISLKNLMRIALATLFALAFSFSLFAFAEEGPDSAEADVVSTALDDEQGTQDADTTAETPAIGPASIPDTEIPLSVRPYETGWSAVNLTASLLTIIIGVTLVILSVIRRNDKASSSNTFGLAIFGMTAAILSTILFTSTAEIQAKMVVADSFTVAHLAVLAVAILCAALTMKRSTEVSQADDTSRASGR